MIEELKTALDKLLQERVTYKKTLGNSLALYFIDKPGEDLTQYFSLDPSWRYLKEGKIILGSGDIPWSAEDFESEQAFREEFDRVCNLNSDLTGAKLISYQIHQHTSDLRLLFEGNQVVETFTNGAKDYHWIFVNPEYKYYAYPDRIEKD